MNIPPPKMVTNYALNAARMVPGMSDLPKMAAALLAEYASVDARILVLGAGRWAGAEGLCRTASEL